MPVDPADQLADYCAVEHTDAPDPDCRNCDERAEYQHCLLCGADFTDGRWWTALGSTAPNGCDHESLTDDWGRELLCKVLVMDVLVGAWLPCNRAVTRPGAFQCDDHLVAAEYQAKVAQR